MSTIEKLGAIGSIASIVGLVVTIYSCNPKSNTIPLNETKSFDFSKGGISLDLNLTEYFEKLRSYQDNFALRDQFLETVKDRTVIWSGPVTDIQKSNNGQIYITIKNEQGYGELAFFIFPENYEFIRFTLGKGQKVLCQGTIKEHHNESPVLVGHSLVNKETQQSNQPDRK
ncbi:hypothetical protein A7E78_11045 [Syntrophotalea acetylenivorans]|uniref:OB-fold nucleic acid binding domain-containing protein n=1 Tax=Syntrophotalea acetylenivorans TaxID=1842532 RepID=A0A1L3GRQ3_9BACT|nr:hypothetical protein A7E78_11045 [Syntrophotalea acetylenivorans]